MVLGSFPGLVIPDAAAMPVLVKSFCGLYVWFCWVSAWSGVSGSHAGCAFTLLELLGCPLVMALLREGNIDRGSRREKGFGDFQHLPLTGTTWQV
jgi:hypothetical protein